MSTPTLTPIGADDCRITDLDGAPYTARPEQRSRPPETNPSVSEFLANHPERGKGMRTRFEIWTSRARELFADALEYSHDVIALARERIPLEPLPVPDEPLLSWSVYLAGSPAKWLGT